VSRIDDDAGMAGGQPGSADRIVIRDGQTESIDVEPLAYRQPLAAGDRVVVAKGGGPGWGVPFERAAEAVRDDVIDGYVSRAAAREQYGVVVRELDLTVDADATVELRRSATGALRKGSRKAP
jgi:N-methylhydantoinase B